MADAFHQIGAAQPLRAARRVRREGRGVVKQRIPARQQRTHIEREGQLRFWRLGLHGGLRHQVAIQRLHVRVAQLGIGRVRKRGIELAAVLVYALAHGAFECGVRPAADAGVVVGRDVGGIDRAEGGVQRQPARVGLASWRSVAGDAITRGGDKAAAFDGAH